MPKSCDAERDLLRNVPSLLLFWILPWAAFIIGFSVPSTARTVLWTAALAVMGVACMLNASRCGRVHCHFTGPFFVLAAIASLAYGTGVLPLGPSGWSWIGLVTVIGAVALCCIPEMILGKYQAREKRVV